MRSPSTDGSGAPLRVAVHHLGCKLNQYETEAFKARFDRLGYEIVPFRDDADVYVVNTCTVTGSGDADSRRAVRRARRRNPEAVVVATGCYAQRRPEDLRTAGATIVVGNGGKTDLPDTVHARLSGLRVRTDFTPSQPPRRDRFLRIDGTVAGGRTRGTLQIQDGCDEHCTYCIIPSVRGASVSRPPGEVLDQARAMVDSGYRELALTGVHSGSYGQDRGDPRALVDLLSRLESIDGLERLRLNSIEPGYVTDDLIDFAAASERLCRHFHVPLQSGDDRVLRRMGRRYTARSYAGRIECIADRLPGCAIGADVMVGFPGETPAHYDSTRRLIEGVPLTYLHVFAYSARDGTPAQRLDGHAPAAVKGERSGALITLGQAKRLAFHRAHVGQRVCVLVEHLSAEGLASGLTDNYIRVRFEGGGQVRVNDFAHVTLTHAREDAAFGERAAA